MTAPRRLALVLIAALLAGCSGTADTVSVSGKAEREVMPDYFEIHLLLEARGEDSSALSGLLEERLQQVLGIAREYALDDEDIHAWELQLRQEMHWDPERRRQVPGEMRLTRKVRLDVDAAADMGALLGDLLASRATQIEQIRARLADPEAVRRELLAEATRAARQRAEGIAKGDGRSAGRLLGIEEAGSPQHRLMATARMEQDSPEVGFNPEPVSISAEVNAVFALD